VTDEIRDAAATLPGSVRILDAIHIASAQVIGDALAFLVSYDKRMPGIAHSVGIPIAASGMSR
jgi:predicted nucleic acid-binding protein